MSSGNDNHNALTAPLEAGIGFVIAPTTGRRLLNASRRQDSRWSSTALCTLGSRSPYAAASAAGGGSATAMRLSRAPRLYPTLSPQRSSTSSHGDAPGVSAGERTLLWFRSDLRLDDHPALREVAAHARSFLPLYCFDPQQFGRTSYGFEKTGWYRAKFLLESVEQLRAALRERGAELVVRFGRPEDVIAELCDSARCSRVVYHREVTYEEQQIEQSLAKRLGDGRVKVDALWSNTLYHVDDLPFAVEEMPDVYTRFRESVERRSSVQAALDAPRRLPPLVRGVDAGRLPTFEELGLDSAPPSSSSSGATQKLTLRDERYKGGEQEARRRLRRYIADARSGVQSGAAYTLSHLGADFSCQISPWLALGCVSPRRIFAELKRQNVVPEVSKSTTYFELVWRDFFRFITLVYGAARLRGNGGVRSSSSAAAAADGAAQATSRASAGVQQQLLSAMAP